MYVYLKYKLLYSEELPGNFSGLLLSVRRSKQWVYYTSNTRINLQ